MTTRAEPISEPSRASPVEPIQKTCGPLHLGLRNDRQLTTVRAGFDIGVLQGAAADMIAVPVKPEHFNSNTAPRS